MATEPILAPAGEQNAYGTHTFHVRATFGSGAVASYRSKDATFARSTTGTFTVTLPKAYREIVSFGGGFKDATGAPLTLVISDESTLGTTGVVTFESRVAAGTATDPASGDKLYLSLTVSCDTLNDSFTG